MTDHEMGRILVLLMKQMTMVAEILKMCGENLPQMRLEIAQISDVLACLQDKNEREGKDAPAVHPYEADEGKNIPLAQDLPEGIARKIADMAAAREQRERKSLEECPRNLRLYIRDKSNGETHLIGTDVHDRLYVGSDGIVRYENMQNGCGTEYTSPITIDMRGVYGDRCEYLLHCLKSVGEYEFVPTPDDEL